MRSLLLVLFLSFCLGACGGGGVDGASATTTFNDPIVGEWLMVYDGTLCEETYDFNADNSFTIESLDERIAGEYTTSAVTGNDDRNRIDLAILTDNGLSDCEGNSVDDSNTQGFLFYEIVGDTFYWFATSSSAVALSEMQRQ